MDVETVVRAQGGDHAAFARLAEALGPRFHGVAFGILRDRALAEDAAQQALVSVWRELPRLRDPERFEAWAVRILVHACYSESRRARRWLPGLTSPAQEPVAPDVIGGLADRDQIEGALRRLSIEHRVVLVLRYYLDLPLGEMAEALGVPVGTVGSRLHRAIGDLRAALDADARGVSLAATPGEALR